MGVEETFVRAAQEIVRRLTPQIVAAWHEPVKSTVTKRDGSIVTDTDQAVEREAMAQLSAALPEVLVVGEENSSSRCDLDSRRAREYYLECLQREYCVFVDPIDGTKNFAHGDPLFCVSIGLTRRVAAGQVAVAGVVAIPVEGVMFSTEGTRVNREAISTGEITSVTRKSREAHFIFANSTEKEWMEKSKRYLKGQRVSHGSSVYDLLQTCLGENRAALVGSQRMWDLAAPWALASSLGLKLCDAVTEEEIVGLGPSDFDEDLEQRAWRLSRRAVLLPRNERVGEIVST